MPFKRRKIILSTHIVSDVEFIANRIMLMKSGRFSFIGTAEELVGLVSVIHFRQLFRYTLFAFFVT